MFWTRKNKRKAQRILILSTCLLVFGSLLYLFYLREKPILISPVPTSNKTVPFRKTTQIEDLRNLLVKFSIPFLSISKSKDAYKIDLGSGVSVFVTLEKDLKLQVSSLQSILKQLTIEGKVVKSIDFRFDKPIIISK